MSVEARPLLDLSRFGMMRVIAVLTFCSLEAAQARLLRSQELPHHLQSSQGETGLSDGMLRMRLMRAATNSSFKGRGAPVEVKLAGDVPLNFLQYSGPSISSTHHPPEMSVFGQIRVGNPPQEFNVAFDTCSGHLILVAQSCRDVGCLAHRAYDEAASEEASAISALGAEPGAIGESVPEHVNLAISTGTAEGDLLFDHVCLGGLTSDSKACAETGIISMTSMSQEPWNTYPYDGILGLGTVGSSLEPRFNFLGNLAEAGLLKRNRFAVWLATEDDTEESEITFGDFPPERLGSEMAWLPLSRTDTGLWQVNMPDVYVRDTRLNVCGSGCEAAFDTGTAVIAGPSGMIKGILSQLNVKQDCSNYASLPLLGFALGSYVMNLERFDYVKKVGDICYHQLMELDIPGQPGLVLLGDPFMRRYFTVFDRESLKVGISFSNHANKPGTTETNLEKTTRLMKQL